MAIEFKKCFECWFVESPYKYHNGVIQEDGDAIEISDAIFTIEELEQVINKMKELREEKK